MVSKLPTFNLKVVLKETGLAADTLRAWERRYGLPQPGRSAGGHRLYSQRDIETIKWLMQRQKEGFSISRAVDLWNEKIASGSDPLADLQQDIIAARASLSLETVRHDWLEACFKFDTVAAEQILNQAFAVHSVELTCTEVIMRGLSEVGENWYRGTATVQQEHFASGIAMRRLEALISATPPPTHTETIILACPPNEWHAFPLLLINLLLRRRGWNVVYLGANVPLLRIQETTKVIQPRLVILSAQTLINALTLQDMARALKAGEIQTGFGGRTFNDIPALVERIPAHFLGNKIELSLQRIENLILNEVPVPAEDAPEDQLQEIANAFRDQRGVIESRLMHESPNQMIAYLETANRFLGDGLIASLRLGDINYLSKDMLWLKNLLTNHDVSVALLPTYLETYAAIIDEVMGVAGGNISAWLNGEAEKYKTGS